MAGPGCPAKGYFYPRSPCGERHQLLYMMYLMLLFLSTLSLRRATLQSYSTIVAAYISIHALLAESDSNCLTISPDSTISIHALLAESDSKSAQNSGVLLRI